MIQPRPEAFLPQPRLDRALHICLAVVGCLLAYVALMMLGLSAVANVLALILGGLVLLRWHLRSGIEPDPPVQQWDDEAYAQWLDELRGDR